MGLSIHRETRLLVWRRIQSWRMPGTRGGRLAGMRSANAARVASRDWFRSPDWGDVARADFAARLARARPWTRPQYRRIKALALIETGDPERQAAGRALFADNISNPGPHPLERVTALCLLGAHEQDVGNLDDAERHLREALRLMVTNPSGGSGLEAVRLAEILLARGGRDELEEARRLINGPSDSDLLFLSSRFRRCLAGARIALALGDQPSAATWARQALQLSVTTHSGLANHPRLGLVEMNRSTFAWLKGIAGG